jgi:putative endopeptidase
MKKKLYLLCSLFIIGLIFPALGQEKSQVDFLSAVMDKSVDPGKDFFSYATGTWMKNNPIPASERGWTVGHLVQEETYSRLKGILEEASTSKTGSGSNKQKIGDYYAAGLDTAAIEKLGLKPLKKELANIDAVKDKKSLINAVMHLQSIGVSPLFGMFVDQDAMNSDAWALYLWQGGIGLPERDYYFRDDARTENIRKEYVKHIANILALSGITADKAASYAGKIFAMEKAIADSSRKLEDLRDPYLNYNKMSVGGLQKITPDITWSELFSKAGIKIPDSVIVGQPEFYKQIEKLLNQYSVNDWKIYLKWHLLNSFADKLGSVFEKENFHFKGTVMSGVKEQRPRWKRIQDVVESDMGELLGQVYVEKYYSPDTKKRYEKLVDDIITAYGERIKKLDWMSPETKEKALEKLHCVTKKVGYPDKWKDFSKLTIVHGAYIQNAIAANQFWFNRYLQRLGKPVDRTEWNMTPQTYNAYYNPSNNEMVLPAAIFIIPGVPDSLIDDAVVYSYAGASTIGHELTHGFDDQGRQFDAKGNLHNWWLKEDEEKFNKKTDLMVEQFDGYVVLDSMHVNGKATLGENIADLGGLVTGLDAFKKTKQYQEGKLIAGLTPEQRFWLGYAYSWLGHKRPEALAQQVMTDVHSPEYLRVNGPLSNIPDFYKAFDIKPGSPMFRSDEKRVVIW